MIILADHQGAIFKAYSGVKEWSHLPDIHWFSHSLSDFYKLKANGARGKQTEKDMRGREN